MGRMSGLKCMQMRFLVGEGKNSRFTTCKNEVKRYNVVCSIFLPHFLKYMHIDHQHRFFAAKITIKHFFRSLVPSHLSLDTGSESTYKHYMHMLIIFHQIYSQFYTNGTSAFVWK